MSNAHIGHARIGGRATCGDAASRVARLLGFVAAPAFAAMAVWSGAVEGEPASLCLAALDAPPLTGMFTMYLLMAVFHSVPWLQLTSRACRDARRC